ncbi:MAG: glycosyltransferase family 39 protein [Phycisphaerae bacterium]|nr:glycosyltransferase family 39 protein [Phycisphaerae bacterium]
MADAISTSGSTSNGAREAQCASATGNERRDDIAQSTALRWLILIMAAAAVLRTAGITYQLPVPTGPDHSSLIAVSLRMGTGDLNPHWFTWPAAPFYFLAGCFGLMFAACRALGVVSDASEMKQWFFEDPSAFYLYVRFIMVATGLVSVAVMYRIGCLLRSRRVGLLAAAILAVTPAEVILCHYQKAEPLLVLATLLALAALIRWWRHDSPWRTVLAGAAIGLACAVKYNAAPLVLPALAAWLHHAFGELRGQRGRLLGRLALGVAAMLVVFLALNPYLLLDATEAARQLSGQKELMTTGRGGLHVTPAWSYVFVVFPIAFGWVLYAAFAVGLAWLAVVSVRGRGVEVLLLAFVIAYGGMMMTTRLVTAYYPLPIVPALALGLAGAIDDVARRWRHVVWLSVILLLFPMGRSLILDYRLALPEAISRAEHWVADNIPSGQRLVHHHWLPPLLAANRYRLGCYPWQQNVKLNREDLESIVERGVTWMVFDLSQVAGRESELFGPEDKPLAREIKRFEGQNTLLPARSGGVSIWHVNDPAPVPPLVEVLDPSRAISPRHASGAIFQGDIALLGSDPPTDLHLEPGQIIELCVYWRMPTDETRKLLVTGEFRGQHGVLSDLTHELGYGVIVSAGTASGPARVFRERILVRANLRAKPGEYRVMLGLRDVGSSGAIPVVSGAGSPGTESEVASLNIQP